VRPITVVLADDHTIVRQGFLGLLALEDDIQVIGEAKNGREAVQLVKDLVPAVVVMDLAMPLLNGLEATQQILEALPATRVLILSAYGDDAYVDRAAEIGAAGYLVKEASAAVLPLAIREVHKGSTYFSPAVFDRLRERQRMTPCGKSGRLRKRVASLTSREVEVLQLVAEGLANKQSAVELGISVKTIEKHRQSLMEKLDIHDTAGLTRYAIAAGIIASGVRMTIE
jgi:DNA-binding NarL/FixJ family response regulator